jgi:hypothetical protein
MAKFTGKSMTATFGGVALTCLTGIETNQQADIYTAAQGKRTSLVQWVTLTLPSR